MSSKSNNTPIKKTYIKIKKNFCFNSKTSKDLDITLFKVINNSNEGILLVNEHYQVICSNKKIENIFKGKENPFVINSLFDFIDQNLKNKLINKILEFKDNETRNIKFKHTLKNYKNKSINLLITLNKLYNKDKQDLYVFYFRDVTKDVKIKKDLLLTKGAVENANKLKFLFLTQMSHEIRTPINVIVSFSSLLKNNLKNLVNDDLSTAFDVIDKASNRIIRTIDLLLNFAEIQTHSYECIFKEVNINNILLNISQEYTPIAEKKGLVLKYNNYNNNNFRTIVDEYSVIKIFTHLIENAIKYTNKGSINISLANSADGKIIAKIEDTGIGISKKYLPQIFNSFSQEEQGYTRKYDGNGIGLTLVKEYCKLNNIQIEVNSKKNIGTTFTLFF